MSTVVCCLFVCLFKANVIYLTLRVTGEPKSHILNIKLSYALNFKSSVYETVIMCVTFKIKFKERLI